MKIGYLGPNGSFSQDAAIKYMNDAENIVFDTIEDTVSALENNIIDRCLVPFDNLIYGTFLDTMDAILDYEDIYIIDEITIDINYVLMSKKKNTRIAKVYSHPQALAQCKRFLEENYSEVEKVPVSSTSYAAELASKESGAACLSNITCKEIYNLEVISDKVQEIKKDQTKFVVLSKNKNERKTEKTTLIFSTKDEPGALYKVLGLFSFANINLTKIESRPSKSRPGDYIFLVDMDGDEKEERVEKTFEKIQEYCDEFRIIGSY